MGDEGSAANVLRKAVEVVGLMRRCLVSHSARRGPTFNACLSAGTDPGSVLHVNLQLVPGFSGGSKYSVTPVIPRWLQMPEFTQTMTLLRGELPLMPTGSHFEDIRVHCLVMWSWMAVLLQYWQDHMTPHLYGGRFCRISDLAATLIRDINPWLPHQVCFGSGYVAMNATLWIDLRDHFSMEHLEEWAEQKEQECALNDLERDTEVVYRARIIRRQEDKLLTDSKEAAAKDLPPERWVARAERQACDTLRKDGVSSTSMSATLYPNWALSWAGKLTSPDTPQPYRTPREDAGECLTLEEELDASSMFNPLQSSQGAEGPWTPSHYSETPTYIPSFDIAKVGVLPKMSPITDQENALLNLTPGSPVTRAAPPGLGQGQGGSGRSSCSGSPMSLGSPAVGSSLALALKVRTHPGTPSAFGGREELPLRKRRRRWMPRKMITPIRPKIELNAMFTRPSRLVWRVAR